MYKLIGTDGRMYGPVTPEQLRQWLTEGRANAQTLVQPVGSPDWKPLAEFPELLPPPLPSPLPPRVVAPPQTNTFAIASLVLGSVGWALVCCGPVIWITGIIFAGVALSQINHSAGTQTGKGLAWAGLWLSIAGLLALVIWATAACWLPAWHISRFGHHGRYW